MSSNKGIEMTKYQIIREQTLSEVRSLEGMENFFYSQSTVPQGTISVGIETQEKLDRLAEILTELDVDHLPSPVSSWSHVPFTMYFREEDLIFAVMEKDAKDVENAEDAFVKQIDDMEKELKRFISYNDFVKWYFMVWITE